MRFASTIEVALLLAGIVSADFGRFPTKPGTSPLIKRETCTLDTCAECYGPGMIVCSNGLTLQTCFNPSAGEQCCGDGTYCVGTDTSCCGSAGAGVTITDEAPSATATGKKTTGGFSATATFSAPEASSSSWDCFSSDSNEECCQRGGSENHWCWGNFPTRYCYRPTLGEVCCSDGNICTGSGCCSDFGAVATTPNPTAANAVSTSSSKSTGGLSLNTNAFASTTTSRQVTIPGAGTTTTSTRSSLTGATGAAAPREIVGGAFVAAAGLFGLALI